MKRNKFEDYLLSLCLKEAIEKFISDYEVQNTPKLYIEEDFTFRGSDKMLIAILVQIFLNAYECSQTQGEISIRVKDRKIYITNKGSIIANEDLPHIFNEFFTNSEKKLGLGLYFAKEAMQAFGGDIQVSPSKAKDETCVVLSFD